MAASESQAQLATLAIALDKVQKESRKYQTLKVACKDALTSVKARQKSGDSTPLNPDEYFTPFRLGCETGSTRVMEPSLDWMQKIFQYECIAPDAPGNDPKEPAKKLIDVVVDTVCNCFEDAKDSDRVQLQIIKTLIPSVSSSRCNVHGPTLLRVVRTIYNIFLVSRNLVNQNTARAALVNIIEIIFQRMERAAEAMPVRTLPPAQQSAAADGAAATPTLSTDGELRKLVVEIAERVVESTPGMAAATAVDNDDGDLEIHEANHSTHEVTQEDPSDDENRGDRGNPTTDTESEARERPPNPATLAISSPRLDRRGSHSPDAADSPRPLMTPVTSPVATFTMEPVAAAVAAAAASPAVAPVDAVAGKYGFCVVCGKTANNFSAQTRAPLCSTACRDIHLEAWRVKLSTNVPFEVLALDSFLVFKAFCKQSVKDIPMGAAPDSVDMRSKVLSLELLLLVLETSGEAFRRNDKFIVGVKQFLCASSLLKNGVSSNSSIFSLSLKIFKIVMDKFKEHLKLEVGVFFEAILLQILESVNSTAEQKAIILDILGNVCQQPQAIVDLFVNYDCEIKGSNIFERMVQTLSRIANGSKPRGSPEANLELASLQCMVSIVNSMVDWSRNYVPPRREPGEGQVPVVPLSMLIDPNDPDALEKQRRVKAVLKEGIEKFNTKPKKGIAFLAEQGLIENTHDSICEFLRTNPDLNKVEIGDYIGDEHEFNKEVCQRFFAKMDFRGMPFTQALRMTLSTGGFRLPGEAQKIDRIMVCFAATFYAANQPPEFGNTDAVYVLAFATIMLNTDLYSPSIKKKITKEDFMRMNRGVNNNKDFDAAFLSSVFDDIARQEIKLKDDEQAVAAAGSSDPREQRALYYKEAELMADRAKNMMRGGTTPYIFAKPAAQAKLMFQAAWHPMMAVMSVLVEQYEDERVINLCLSAFANCIHITGLFGLDTERKAFVTSLTKFTFLNTVREMKAKNIESIKTLINIALGEGSCLGESWCDVLRSISQLERLQLYGNGRQQEVPPPAKKKPAAGAVDRSVLEAQNAQAIAANIDALAIDRIFTRSTDLTHDAIVEFIRQLCLVSKEELPRIFLLHKLVDVALFNMSRPLAVWTRMWEPMNAFLAEVGCHGGKDIADLAVDSLRQLSMQFLSTPELCQNNFQRKVLQPFEHIMAKNKNVEIRDIVLVCLLSICRSRSETLKGGWKAVFTILCEAAAAGEPTTVKTGFEGLDKILQECFVQTTEYYVDVINCLMDFGKQQLVPDVSLRAVDFVHFCARELAEGRVTKLEPSADGVFLFTDDTAHMRYWWPLLTGLSNLVGHQTQVVRTKALQVLFDVLKTFGKQFSTQLWAIIFKGVLFPIFDDVRHSSEGHSEWLKSTCLNAFRALVDLFRHHYGLLQFMLHDMLKMLISCILQESESLARIGATVFLQLIMESGEFFDDKVWTDVCTMVKKLFDDSTPQSLMTFGQNGSAETLDGVPVVNGGEGVPHVAHVDSDEGLSGAASGAELDAATPHMGTVVFPQQQQGTNFQLVIIKCVVQLLMIQAVNDIFTKHYSRISNANLRTLLDCLQSSYDFARIFNANMELRLSLWKAGFMKQLPNLLKQETTGVQYSLRMLFQVYNQQAADDTSEMALYIESRLMGQMAVVVSGYMDLTTDKQREIVSWSPIIIVILSGLGALDDAKFKKAVARLYPLLMSLIESERRDVRQALRQVTRRMGVVFGIADQSAFESTS